MTRFRVDLGVDLVSRMCPIPVFWGRWIRGGRFWYRRQGLRPIRAMRARQSLAGQSLAMLGLAMLGLTIRGPMGLDPAAIWFWRRRL